MTLMMVWKELGAERLWTVSDSRLSNSGHEVQRITDRAAKILEVPLTLRRPISGSSLGEPIRSTTLGFAYAGSSLVALQTYAAVLPLWSRLQTSGVEVLPSIRDCSTHLSKFVEAYFQESMGPCQCILIGYDDPTQMLDGWVVETNVTEPRQR
jgi:hypothetical protein